MQLQRIKYLAGHTTVTAPWTHHAFPLQARLSTADYVKLHANSVDEAHLHPPCHEGLGHVAARTPGPKFAGLLETRLKGDTMGGGLGDKCCRRTPHRLFLARPEKLFFDSLDAVLITKGPRLDELLTFPRGGGGGTGL